jgi:hypothetical protein
LPVSASNIIEPAFRHAKEQLFRPFRFGQWWRLAVVGLLAGESYGGCNANFNVPANSQHRTSQAFLDADFPAKLANFPALHPGLIAAFVVVTIILVLLFLYISSVMRFILFDSLVARECRIRRGWRRRKHVGFRYFVWQLLFLLAILAAFAIVIGIPAAAAWFLGWFSHASDHVLGLVLSGIVLFFVVFALFVFLIVVAVMTKDFVVPQMALEDIAVMEGWRRLWLWIKHEKGGYAGYIGLKIVLAIAAAIIFVIITIVVLLLLVLIVGAIVAAVLLGGKAAGWTWNPYTITLAVVLGGIGLALLIFVVALIAVPVAVFFPAYSIYFFEPRYSQLGSLLWPEPTAPAAPAAPG